MLHNTDMLTLMQRNLADKNMGNIDLDLLYRFTRHRFVFVNIIEHLEVSPVPVHIFLGGWMKFAVT